MKKVAIGVLVAVIAVLCLSMALGNWGLFLMMALIAAGVALPFNYFKIKSRWLKFAVGTVVFCLVYFLAIYPVLDRWMTAHYPGTWQVLQLQMVHHDLEMAQKYSIAGNGIDAVTMRNAKVMNDAAAEEFAEATKPFIDKVALGNVPSHEDSVAYFEAQLEAKRKRQTTQVVMAGGLIMTPAAVTGDEVNGDHIYLEVDVKDQDGIIFEIPAGMTAQISIDSAWYNCGFKEMERGENRWCDADGYGIAPKKTKGGAAFTQRFLNPDESMGAVLAFDDNNPQGYRLAMGQTISVTSDFVTIAVNDWRGGAFGGIGMDGFTASKQLRRGGFFDNRGYLRVLIVLIP
jgi:hypothetical protein